MIKRVTLTDDDIKLIVAALEGLHMSSIINEAAYPQHGYASRQRITQIKAKLGFGATQQP